MKTIFAFLLSIVAVPAFAQSLDSNVNAGSESSSGAAAQSGSSLTFHSGDQIRQAPGVGVGSIGTSFASDYCMGAVQGGFSIPGGSAAFGKAVRDENCDKRRNVERLNQIAATYQALHDVRTAGALRQASINLMCSMDVETYNALVTAGVNCQVLPGGNPVNR